MLCDGLAFAGGSIVKYARRLDTVIVETLENIKVLTPYTDRSATMSVWEGPEGRKASHALSKRKGRIRTCARGFSWSD